MNYWISLLALAALSSASPAGAEAYKCRTADGRVEIANIPCPAGANTLKTVSEEKIPEANRLQAEREVERMRDYVEKREAAQRADAAAERESQQRQAAADAGNSPAASRSIEDCLRELDRQALPAMQRVAMESACRSNPSSPPTYVPVPVPVYGGNLGGNPAGSCRQNVEHMNVSPAERDRLLRQCAGSYLPPTPPARPLPPPTPPAPAPSKAIGPAPPPCLPGTNCLRR